MLMCVDKAFRFRWSKVKADAGARCAGLAARQENVRSVTPEMTPPRAGGTSPSGIVKKAHSLGSFLFVNYSPLFSVVLYYKVRLKW